MREDGRQQVCIVGLQEFEILDVQIAKEYIEKGNTARSTGSTGANEESSRSHAILLLAVKKHNEVKDSRRNNDGNDSKSGKVIGKISFIDLAGSERGADTTDMINKQGEFSWYAHLAARHFLLCVEAIKVDVTKNTSVLFHCC